jgi:flavorubredoxin
MKTLVFYYSLTGKTRKKCETIAKLIGADTYPIFEVKKRNIFGAYIFGSHSAMQHKGSEIMPITVDVNQFDTIMIVSPIWAGAITPAINSLLRSIDIKGKNIVAAINSAGGSSLSSDGFKKEIEANGGNVVAFLNLSKASTDDELSKLLSDNNLQ